MNNDQKIRLAKLGENFAVSYLKSKKYDIIKTNYHSAYGEIDIISFKDNTICFVEVKTRSSQISNFESALNSVSNRKQKKIIKTAEFFLSHNYQFDGCFTRFDVIALLYDAKKKQFLVKYLKDAFA